MSLRQKLNDNSKLAVIAAAVLIAVALVVIVYQVINSGPQAPARDAPAFYTTDDGATTFTAPAIAIPPIDHEGQPAVRAVMFECDGEQFVGYLERYTDEAKALIDSVNKPSESATPGPPPNLGAAIAAQQNGRIVKKPGDKDWVPALSTAGRAITSSVKCPDGETTALLVQP